MADEKIWNDVSDGYHTFGELYAHRRVLTAALASALPECSWRSKAHHPEDGPIPSGYFIVGISLPGVGAITYHYEIKHWDDFCAIPAVDHAAKWDQATPADTVARLQKWALRSHSK